MRHDSEMDTSSRRGPRFVKRHSLSIAAAGLLLAWILLYARSNPRTHLGWWSVTSSQSGRKILGLVLLTND